MLLSEVAAVLSEEGDFSVVAGAVNLEVTLHDFGAQLRADIPWATVASWESRDVIWLSVRMWDKLYRVSQC